MRHTTVFVCRDLDHAQEIFLREVHLLNEAHEIFTTNVSKQIPRILIDSEEQFLFIPAKVEHLKDDTVKQWITKVVLPKDSFRTIYRVPIGDLPSWLLDALQDHTPSREK